MYNIKLKTVDTDIQQEYLFSDKENKDLFIITISVTQNIWKEWKKYLANTIIAVVNTQLQIIDYISVPNYLTKIDNKISTLSSISEKFPCKRTYWQ